MNNARVVALDIGEKTVGIAVTDTLLLFARPFSTVFRQGAYRDDAKLVRAALNEIPVIAIVTGWPETLGGEAGRMTKITERFVRHLTPLFPDVPFFRQDESFSTETAVELTLQRTKDVRAQKRSGDLDARAAAVILTEFMLRDEFQRIRELIQPDS